MYAVHVGLYVNVYDYIVCTGCRLHLKTCNMNICLSIFACHRMCEARSQQRGALARRGRGDARCAPLVSAEDSASVLADEGANR
jgi:hypothetical protein